MTSDGEQRRVPELLGEAKALAREYRELTGKPRGITGEVAEYETARVLGVTLTAVRQVGYDAVDPAGRKLQIKGRRVRPDSKPGQRLGRIDVRKPFDAVLRVLLDEDFDATSIHEPDRTSVIYALTAPGSKARNRRGALSVGKLRWIGRLVWERKELSYR